MTALGIAEHPHVDEALLRQGESQRPPFILFALLRHHERQFGLLSKPQTGDFLIRSDCLIYMKK